jgi:hypothetical protein
MMQASPANDENRFLLLPPLNKGGIKGELRSHFLSNLNDSLIEGEVFTKEPQAIFEHKWEANVNSKTSLNKKHA